MTNNTATQPEKPSGSSVKIIASAVVVAVIATAGVTLTVTNLVGRGASPPAASRSAAEQTTPDTNQSALVSESAVPAGEASVCGLTDVEMTGTVTTAPTATWTLIGGIAAPSVEGAGPGVVEDNGYRSCYARTPTGALTALANYAVMGSYGPLRETLYHKGVVPGPGRDILLSKPISSETTEGPGIQIAGFRILRYDGTYADIDLVVRLDSGEFVGVVRSLQWVEGDWKYGIADDATELGSVNPVPSLSGYIPWSGV